MKWGLAIHAGLALLFQQLLDERYEGWLDPSRVMRVLRGPLESKGLWDEDRVRRITENLVRWVGVFRCQECLGVEVPFRSRLKGVPSDISGRVDFLGWEDRILRIVDWKTGAPSRHDWKQLKYYAVGISRKYRKRRGLFIQGELWYLERDRIEKRVYSRDDLTDRKIIHDPSIRVLLEEGFRWFKKRRWAEGHPSRGVHVAADVILAKGRKMPMEGKKVRHEDWWKDLCRRLRKRDREVMRGTYPSWVVRRMRHELGMK